MAAPGWGRRTCWSRSGVSLSLCAVLPGLFPGSSRNNSRMPSHARLGGTAMARYQRLARVFVMCLFFIVVLSAPFTASMQASIYPAFAEGGGGGGGGGG